MGLDMYLKGVKKLNEEEQSKLDIIVKRHSDASDELDEIYDRVKDELFNGTRKVDHNGLKTLKEYLEKKYELDGELVEDEDGSLVVDSENFIDFRKYMDINEDMHQELRKILENDSEYLKYLEKYRETSKEYNDFVSLYNRELGYWRKHADLNGYFTNLYEQRGGTEEFNCKDLILTKEDCLEVIELAKNALVDTCAVEHATGFFWGESTKEDWEETISIFNNVLETVDFDKEEVVYSCWY